MCDYSLYDVPNRLAVEGEPLCVHRFFTGSVGLAPSAELRPAAEPPAGIWAKIHAWFSSICSQKATAVCIPPGARLILRDIPQSTQLDLEVGDEEEVEFTQLSANANTYRDAVRFSNGRELLLQKLAVGQRVDVLCLTPNEAIPEQVERKIAQLP